MGAPAKKLTFDEEIGNALLDDSGDDSFHNELSAALNEPDEPSFVSYKAPEAVPEHSGTHAPDLLERFLAPGQAALDAHAGELRDAWDTAGDAASGLAGGMTGHLDQALPFGIGDAIRADREASLERSPVATRGADLVGTVASPIGKVARAESLVGNMAAQGVNAAALGTARRVGDQQDGERDVLQAFVDSLGDAKTGALIGGGAHVLGEVAGAGADAAHGLKNYLRRTAMGVQRSDVADELAARGTSEGLRYSKEDLSQLPEKLGLSNWIRPNSTSDYATKAEALRKEGGALKGSALDRADAVVPPEQIDLAKDDVLQRLVSSRDADAAAYSGVSAAPAYDDLATRLQNRVPSRPSDLDAMKQEYEGNSYALATAPAMERGSALANKTAADEARMRLGGIISGANRADPGIAADFERGSQQFGDAATVEDIAKRAAAKNIVAPMLGGAVGGLAGFQTRHDLEGAGLGAVGGALATRGLQNYGADFGANMMRGGEGVMRGASDALQGMSQAGGATAAWRNNGGSPGDQQQSAMASGRGQDLPRAINDLLITDPSRLGRWRAEFEQAGRTPGGINALIRKLRGDREWREQKLPELQYLTQGAQ